MERGITISRVSPPEYRNWWSCGRGRILPPKLHKRRTLGTAAPPSPAAEWRRRFRRSEAAIGEGRETPYWPDDSYRVLRAIIRRIFF